MPPTTFAPIPVRVPQEYLIGEKDPGLEAFRLTIPPFIHIEIVEEDTPEYENLRTHSVVFESGENLASHVLEYSLELMNDRMGQSTKEFAVSAATDTIEPDADGNKVGIPLIKTIIAEMVQDGLPCDYVNGVKKIYLIHPPLLEDELHRQLNGLLVPPMADSPSERLISVCIGEETHRYVVQPYKMDLRRRRSADPRWLIVHMYNPDQPAMAIQVGPQGPMTFREPTPLLSDTRIAEDWAMGIVQAYLSSKGVEIQDVRHEPNGPKTFPDYEVHVNGTHWDLEVTRVIGDLLKSRHILDQPRDLRNMMSRAVQSPPIEKLDVENALDHAIDSKERSKSSAGKGSRYCLVLVNAAGLDIGSRSDIWQGRNLSSFDSVVVIHGFSQPTVEFIKGPIVQ